MYKENNIEHDMTDTAGPRKMRLEMLKEIAIEILDGGKV